MLSGVPMTTRKKNKPSLVALAKQLDTKKRPVPASATREVKASDRAFIESTLRAKPAPTTSSRSSIESSLRAKPAPTTTSRPNPPKPAPTSSGRAAIENALRTSAPASLVPPARPMAPRPAAEVPPARMSGLPARPAAPAAPAPALFSNRTAALTSLQRAPAPAPAKVPVAQKPHGSPPPRGEVRRQYPRAEIHVRTKLSLADDPSRHFEASLPTVNLSVGGMFLESSYFLKLGTKLVIQLDLPQRGRPVKVKGEVVRVESNTSGASGFALRFTEYLEGSQVILATHFLSPVLREFLVQYAKEHRFDASAEYLAHTADVLAAWELKKAELGGDVWDLFSSNKQSRA